MISCRVRGSEDHKLGIQEIGRGTLYAQCNCVSFDKMGTCKHLAAAIIAYVEEHFQDLNLSLEVLSEQFSLSVSYVSKLFKTYTGEGFKSYLHRLRMERAKQLLLEHNMAIKDLPPMIGFDSCSYFIRCFKTYTNMTPERYRDTFARTDT